MCLFCKIVNKEIPAQVVYEDQDILAFRDIKPQAPTHILVIPKQHIAFFSESTPNINAKLATAVQEIAKKEGLSAGFRVVINNGSDGGQEVGHLHYHILGGRRMTWPPG